MAKLAKKEGINHKKADDSMFDWQGYPLKVINPLLKSEEVS